MSESVTSPMIVASVDPNPTPLSQTAPPTAPQPAFNPPLPRNQTEKKESV